MPMPKKSPRKRRSEIVTVRLTPGERLKLHKMARRWGVTASSAIARLVVQARL
jgi:DNA-binding GntR family transcriptional regulator